MKKFTKSLLSTAFFLTYANKIYAATSTEPKLDGLGKSALIIIGILLIVLILFIGYKLDNATPKESNAKKIPKEKNNKEEEKETEENNYVEDIYKTATEEDVPYETERNETHQSEKIDLLEINETTEYTDEEEVSLFDSVNKVKGYDTFIDDLEENNQEVENLNNEQITNTQSFDSTMVFDTNLINNNESISETETIINKINLEDSDIYDEFKEETASSIANLDLEIDELEDYTEKNETPDDIFGNLPNIMTLENQEVDMDKEIADLEKEDYEIVEEEEKTVVVEETDFGGFTVDDESNKETVGYSPKKYTRKKNTYNKIEENNTNEKSVMGENKFEGVDYNFLAQMEENLIESKNKRLAKEEKNNIEKENNKKTNTKNKTTKKTTAKKSDEKVKKEKNTKTTKSTEKKKKETKKK